MTIILFIIILGVLIFVHELGHFLVAKMSGIRVDEFALGFPPRIFAKKIGETVYALNLVPFGGYVKIFGEDPNEASLSGPDSPRSIARKNRAIQSAVLAAGVFGNFVFAWLLISFGFFSGIPVPLDEYPNYDVSSPHSIIVDIAPDSPAAAAGLTAGDRIESLSVGNDKVVSPLSHDVEDFVSSHGGQEITMDITRVDKPLSVKIVPVEGILSGRPAIGISLASVGTLKLDPYHALIEGTKATWALTVATAKGLWGFLYRAITFRADFSAVSGPVGIAGIVGDASALGFGYLLSVTALISLNLAIINLVPFPALDGGRLFFLLIEAVSRRRIPPRVQNMANAGGFAILIALMLLVTWHDIAKIIH